MILPRVFTIEEANALVPLLQEAFERLHVLIAQAQEVRAALAPPETGGGDVATAPVASSPPPSDMLRSFEREIEHELIQLHRLGVILKGFEPGLVDVWSKRAGEWVFLCWRFGEDRFSHWHGVSEGFAGRQAIDDDDDEFRARFVN